MDRNSGQRRHYSTYQSPPHQLLCAPSATDSRKAVAFHEDALAALEHPVFSVKLDLELTDYSDLESIVMEASQQDNVTNRNTPPSLDDVRNMLTEKTETDEAFRKIATGERKVEKRSVTVEIAPSDPTDDKSFFYGRIREDGRLFILNIEDAQGLDGQLLD